MMRSLLIGLACVTASVSAFGPSQLAGASSHVAQRVNAQILEGFSSLKSFKSLALPEVSRFSVQAEPSEACTVALMAVESSPCGAKLGGIMNQTISFDSFCNTDNCLPTLHALVDSAVDVCDAEFLVSYRAVDAVIDGICKKNAGGDYCWDSVMSGLESQAESDGMPTRQMLDGFCGDCAEVIVPLLLTFGGMGEGQDSMDMSGPSPTDMINMLCAKDDGEYCALTIVSQMEEFSEVDMSTNGELNLAPLAEVMCAKCFQKMMELTGMGDALGPMTDLICLKDGNRFCLDIIETESEKMEALAPPAECMATIDVTTCPSCIKGPLNGLANMGCCYGAFLDFIGSMDMGGDMSGYYGYGSGDLTFSDSDDEISMEIVGLMMSLEWQRDVCGIEIDAPCSNSKIELVLAFDGITVADVNSNKKDLNDAIIADLQVHVDFPTESATVKWSGTSATVVISHHALGGEDADLFDKLIGDDLLQVPSVTEILPEAAVDAEASGAVFERSPASSVSVSWSVLGLAALALFTL